MNKKLLIFALKFIVSTVLIWFIVSNFELELELVKARLEEIQYTYIFWAFAVLGVQIFNNSVRWMIVLNAIHADLHLKIIIKIMYIAAFFNQTLPSSIGGDGFRIFLSRKAGIDVKSAITGVMLERIATVTGLVLLVAASQPFLLARVGDNAAKYIFPSLAGIALFGILGLILLGFLPKRFHAWRIIGWLTLLATDTRKLFFSPIHAFKAILLGATGNILLAVVAFFTFSALKIEVSFLDCLVLVPPVMLITILPISIAGWGVREGAMIGAFAFVGVIESDAFIASLFFGFVCIIFSLPGGLLWLIDGHKRAKAKKETD